MKRVLILVEGQTEERFVKRLLGPHLESSGIAAIPKIVVTKRAKGGHQFKGGVLRYEQVRDDIRRLLGDSGARAVSTMLDYYGLPGDFPGLNAVTPEIRTPEARAQLVESELASDLGDRRLIPYVSLHEFEALLFSEPAEFDGLFPGTNGRRRVAEIRGGYRTPEEINDGRDTHPAARLRRLFPDYDKATIGPVLAQRIGLAKMRAECPHFDGWVKALEQL
jgi:hypothetical protein